MSNGDRPVLETVELGKCYHSGVAGKTVTVLDSVDLTIFRGEVFGILGANGAGKSTTLKILAGLIRPTCGQAWLFDHPIDDPSIRAKIGFMPDVPAFQEYLTAEESLMLSGRLAGLSGMLLRDRIDHLFSTLGLSGVRHRRLAAFSKGMLQRMGLAQALVHDPELILFDEPMSGLDPMGRADVRDLILKLKQAGKTIIFCSHLLHDVELLSDRVGLLRKGRLEVQGNRQELRKASHSGAVDVVLEGLADESMAALRSMSVTFFSDADRVLATFAGSTSLEVVFELIRRDHARLVSLQPRPNLLEPLLGRAE
jgi:ABC-2 type transport system ATP-binding protein